MSNMLNRMLAARAGRMLRLELIFAIMSCAFMMLFLASSIYLERSHGTGTYSIWLGIICLMVSLIFYMPLFWLFRDNIKYRAMKGGTGISGGIMMSASSLFIAISSLVAYLTSFGMLGISLPWHGPGREYLYASYFLMIESAIFFGREAAYYAHLKRYMICSFENLER